ncbi:MAG: hypothetical protein R2828_31895 [Saprospiraceae bacterium]
MRKCMLLLLCLVSQALLFSQINTGLNGTTKTEGINASLGQALLIPGDPPCPGDPCPCDGGYVSLQLYYFGEDNVAIDVYSDFDKNNLITSFANVISGQLLTIDGTGLLGGIFAPYTYLEVTNGGGVACTTKIYSRCPSNVWPGSLQDLQIIGKSFGDFVVFSATDLGNNYECSVADASQDWRVGGNVVVSPNNTLGTLNNEDITLISNNTPQGIITKTGDFGIGTTAPSAKLDVSGNTLLQGTLDVNGVTTIHDATASSTAANGALVVAGGAGVGENINVGNDASVGNDLEVGNDASIDRDLEVGNDANITHDFAAGHNGFIGNDLSVLNNSSVGLNLSVGNNATINANLAVTGSSLLNGITTVNGLFTVNNNANVVGNGFVGGTLGVGTSTIPTGYLLAVDGNIICEELRVQLSGSWPDYVFGKGYDLMPLKKVEAAIRQNGHLPKMPSATELADTGLDMSKMLTLQQEKIEELFLHLIEMEKKIQALEKERQQ